jgi:hypothetical protein
MLEPDPDKRAPRIGPLLSRRREDSPPVAADERPPSRRAGRRARRAERASMPRSPLAPYVGILWTAWGISWAVFYGHWFLMLLAMLPIMALSQWSSDWSKRRARDLGTAREGAQARTRVDAPEQLVRVGDETREEEGEDEEPTRARGHRRGRPRR